MNKPFALSIASFLISISISAQVLDRGIIKLQSFDPADDLTELSLLDNYFDEVRVAGLGESTHGTREFSLMRHRLFRYLVTNHGFNTFFLEADYVVCKPIDTYIKTGEGDPTALTIGLGLWPWETQEMLDVINWMRGYNTEHPNNQLSFTGVDMQKYTESIAALDQLLARYNLSIDQSSPLLEYASRDILFVNKKSDLKAMNQLVDLYRSMDVSTFEEKDRSDYVMILRHLTQCLKEKTSKESSFRDHMMAENLVMHLDTNPEIKGIFWAHNLHIAKFYNEKKGTGVSGGYLAHSLGKAYLSIGLEFYTGSINVKYFDPELEKQKINPPYRFGSVTLGNAPQGSFASNYISLGSPLFIPFDQLIESEGVTMTNIGAAYKHSSDPKSIYLYNHHGRKAFDAIILIRESTPTTMLEEID